MATKQQTAKIQRGQFITYRPWASDRRVKALVKRAHRDGTYTVEAFYFLRNGDRDGGFLGYRYRMNATDLRPA